jgi:hypothetical protein
MPKRQQSAKTVKHTVTLSADLSRRFGVHAEMMGMSKSALFAEMVRATCNRFVISDRLRNETTPVGGDRGGASAA